MSKFTSKFLMEQWQIQQGYADHFGYEDTVFEELTNWYFDDLETVQAYSDRYIENKITTINDENPGYYYEGTLVPINTQVYDQFSVCVAANFNVIVEDDQPTPDTPDDITDPETSGAFYFFNGNPLDTPETTYDEHTNTDLVEVTDPDLVYSSDPLILYNFKTEYEVYINSKYWVYVIYEPDYTPYGALNTTAPYTGFYATGDVYPAHTDTAVATGAVPMSSPGIVHTIPYLWNASPSLTTLSAVAAGAGGFLYDISNTSIETVNPDGVTSPYTPGTEIECWVYTRNSNEITFSGVPPQVADITDTICVIPDDYDFSILPQDVDFIGPDSPPDTTLGALTYPSFYLDNSDVEDIGFLFEQFLYGSADAGTPTPSEFQLRWADDGRWYPNQTDTPAKLKYKDGVSILQLDFDEGRHAIVRPTKDGGFMLYEVASFATRDVPIGQIKVFRHDRTLAAVVAKELLNAYLPGVVNV